MTDVLQRAWWTLVLRGVAAIVIGLLFLFMPGVTVAGAGLSFAILFGAYALIEGAGTIIGSLRHREGPWVLLLVFGGVSAIAGLIALANPVVAGITALVLMVYIVAFKSIVGGIVEIYSAWRLRQEIDNEWLLAINGFFSLLFGLILLLNTSVGIAVLALLTSFYLLMAGLMQIIIGFKVRSWLRNPPKR
ncbi:MAG: DUF308 domain-containing protein [Chloroflexi bacterium]|nr:DUF308 domain-containing protein [Chloroflexota bacterium]MCY4246050.1 DUF308 domain-containing protein [Chloroflexota bacterium]